MKAGNIGGWCNGSTSDFGSENIGSSPVPPTLSYLNNIMFITKSATTLAWESRGILLFKTIMIDILDILKRLQQAKIDNKQEPAIVSMVEVQQEALKMTLEELRRMTREGEINYHQTLNSHAFSIKL